MPINYAALCYGPVFAMQAVTGVLAPFGGGPHDIATLDDTAGVEVEGAETLLPVAHVLFSDLAARNIAPDTLDDGTIAINGRTWRIDSHRLEPSPSGQAQGMVMLLLQGLP